GLVHRRTTRMDIWRQCRTCPTDHEAYGQPDRSRGTDKRRHCFRRCVQRDRRLRQGIRYLPREVHKRRKVPRLSTHAGARGRTRRAGRRRRQQWRETLMTLAREAVVAAARQWIGTPYRHQASVRAVGADCLGLVRGVWREVIGPEPERPPGYTPDWAEALGQDTLLDAARRHMREIAIGEAGAGDVLLFRMALGAPAKHAAIMSGVDRILQIGRASGR